MEKSILNLMQPHQNSSPDRFWDLFSRRNFMRGTVYLLCSRSSEYVRSTQAWHFGPRRASRRIGGVVPRFFEHLGELRVSKQKSQPGPKRKVRLPGDTPASGLTILQVARHPLEQALASERVIIRTWAPAYNTNGLHETWADLTRRLRRRPRARPPQHLLTDRSRRTTPLDSLGVSMEKELIRWQTCRAR